MIRWEDTFADQVAAMADADLLLGYQRTDGGPGNPEANALLAQIERRELDV